MKFVTESSIEAFTEAIGSKPVKELWLVSPFLSESGLKSIKEWIGKKQTDVKLLTNLSDINVALSINNPVEIIDNLEDSINGTFEVKSHPRLHAKMFCVPDRCLLTGSSNLTYGGSGSNLEINCLIPGTKRKSKKEKAHLRKLQEWFRNLWENKASGILSKRKLNRISKDWNKSATTVNKIFEKYSSEPALGHDYWGKVKEIMAKDKLKREDADRILRKGGNRKSKTKGKLIFLRSLELIDFDDETVTVYKSQKGKVEDPRRFLDLLERELPRIKTILDKIRSVKKSSYKELCSELNETHENLSIPVNWLEHLGFIERDDRGSKGDVFRSTDLSKNLHLK